MSEHMELNPPAEVPEAGGDWFGDPEALETGEDWFEDPEDLETEEDWPESPGKGPERPEERSVHLCPCPNCAKVVKVAPAGAFWGPEEEPEERPEKDNAPQPEEPGYQTIRVAKRPPRKQFYW